MEIEKPNVTAPAEPLIIPAITRTVARRGQMVLMILGVVAAFYFARPVLLRSFSRAWER